MILVDVNLLVYAHVTQFAQHERAKGWLDGRLNGRAPVGIPWFVLVGFLRVVTNPRIFETPESTASAWRQVTDWLSSSSTWVPWPTERHAQVLARLLDAPGVRGDLVPDAHLAALAIEHGLILCSSDGDFARFEGLRWHDPLRDDRMP